MKQYRSEQIAKHMLRYMSRGGRVFRNIKFNRKRFKLWLRENYRDR